MGGGGSDETLRLPCEGGHMNYNSRPQTKNHIGAGTVADTPTYTNGGCSALTLGVACPGHGTALLKMCL